MAHRKLTADEKTRLEARHGNPDAWWDHVCGLKGETWAEARLDEQLDAADAVKKELGQSYKPYAERLLDE